MKNLQTIKINVSKELKLSDVEKYGISDVDQFISTSKRYLKAIKEGRIICSIGSVSKSGMSRTMKFLSCEGSIKNGFHYRNYWFFFSQLGFTEINNSDYFRIGGCGMDMVFHTNYTIIHQLQRLGFISKKECSKLAQMTPSVI